MAPLLVDPCDYLNPHHSVGHCPVSPSMPLVRPHLPQLGGAQGPDAIVEVMQARITLGASASDAGDEISGLDARYRH